MYDAYCLCIDLVTVSDAILVGAGGGRGLGGERTVNVWDFGRIQTSITPLQSGIFKKIKTF